MHIHAHKTSKVPESLQEGGQHRLEVLLNWCIWGFQLKTKDTPGQIPWKALTGHSGSALWKDTGRRQKELLADTHLFYIILLN